jgi:hypothetical protein
MTERRTSVEEGEEDVNNNFVVSMSLNSLVGYELGSML